MIGKAIYQHRAMYSMKDFRLLREMSSMEVLLPFGERGLKLSTILQMSLEPKLVINDFRNHTILNSFN